MAKLIIYITVLTLFTSHSSYGTSSKTDEVVGEYLERRELESPKIDKPIVENLPTEITLTLGTFNSRKVDKLTALSIGLSYLGYFSENRYTFKNDFQYHKFSMTDYYTKKNASYEQQNFTSKLMANKATPRFSFFTLFEFLKAAQSSKRATNIEFNFGVIGVEYDLILIPKKRLKKIAIGYIPIYQFLNVDKLNSDNEFIDKNSNEFLLHSLFFKIVYAIKPQIHLVNEFSYAILRDMKLGEYQMKNNEIKNRLDIRFSVTKEITLFYRHDYLADKKREKFYNLPPTDMLQSFNFSYTW